MASRGLARRDLLMPEEGEGESAGAVPALSLSPSLSISLAETMELFDWPFIFMGERERR